MRHFCVPDCHVDNCSIQVLTAARNYWMKQSVNLESENTRLRKALEFYANKENYDFDGAPIRVFDEDDSELDSGRIAREALGK